MRQMICAHRAKNLMEPSLPVDKRKEVCWFPENTSWHAIACRHSFSALVSENSHI